MTTRDTPIFVSTDPDREIALFMRKDGSAEIVITDPLSSSSPTRFNVPRAPVGQRIVMRHTQGAIKVLYTSATKESPL